MRRLAALLLTASVLLTACGCGAEKIPGQAEPEDLVPAEPVPEKPFVLGVDPDSGLDPLDGISQVNRMLTALVYEGLYELDETFEPQPVLVSESSVSEDGLTWQFQMKEGLCFSDGTPLTAGHVSASLRRAMASEFYGGRLKDIASVRASSDGRTVTIRLRCPNGALPALLDLPVVLEQKEGFPLGTGPYCYEQTEQGLQLVRNPNAAASGALEKIDLYPVSDTDQRIAAFDSGRVSAVSADLTSTYELGYSCSYESWDYATANLLFVEFQRNQGPCASPLVRRAFFLEFDRENLVRTVMAGHGDAALLPMSPCRKDYPETAADTLGLDREAALNLLKEAGYRPGADGLLYRGRSPLTVSLLVNGDNAAKRAAGRALAADLEALGVTVTVNEQPWHRYLAALKAGTFDLCLGEVILTADFDLTSMLSGELCYGGPVSPELIAAAGAWKSAGADLRPAAAETLWPRFAEEAPFAPLCFRRESVLTRWGQVKHLAPTRNNPLRGLETGNVQ